MSPLISVLFIVLAVALAGAFIAFLRDRRRYAGYRDIMRDVIAFAKTVNGDIFRDGGDLVISGSWRNQPLSVRLSHAQTTPGTNIRLGAPATFSLAIFSRSERAYEGRALVRLPDETLHAKYEARTDQPTTARLFLSSRPAVAAISKLCRSSYDYLTIGSAAVEFSELGSPSRATIADLRAHLDALTTIADALAQMPSADQVIVEPRQKRRDLVLRATIAAGVIAASLAVYYTSREPQARAAESSAPAPQGIDAADLKLLPGVDRWHLASANDVDPTALAWLQSRGGEFHPKIVLDATGSGAADATAYLLATAGGEKRVALLANGRNVYDARFASLGPLVRVSRDTLKNVAWQGPAPDTFSGDGLLLVRDGEQPGSGLVFYMADGQLTNSAPANWQTITPVVK